MVINLNIDIEYKITNYTEEEINLIKDIFGLFTKDIYFKMKVNEVIDLDKYEFIGFTGFSGNGKTLIKEEIKKIVDCIDFDDYNNFKEKYGEINIMKLFDIKDNSTLKVLSKFGLFEMRILLTPIKNLSNGQIKRLKYIHLINEAIKNNKQTILIDEYGSELDNLSVISFTRALSEYAKEKNIKLFTFGVNDSYIGQLDVNELCFVVGNSCISTKIYNGEVVYNVYNKPIEKIGNLNKF